jgi:hypothetical protein
VYKPSVGVFTMYPIKMFDTDTFFSDYSYTQTPEVFRYFTTERLIPKNAYDGIRTNSGIGPAYISTDNTTETMSYFKELDLFENWRLYGNFSNSIGDLTLTLQGYDAISNDWIELEKITLRNFYEEDTFIFNTYFPVYFYNASEDPNDPDPVSAPNSGPQYTMVGKRNYDKKTYNLERTIFTKARLVIDSYVTAGTSTDDVFIVTVMTYLLLGAMDSIIRDSRYFHRLNGYERVPFK